MLVRQVVDKWYKTEDTESFKLARELIKFEGLIVDGSSGSAMSGALRALEWLGYAQNANKRVVVLLPDGHSKKIARCGRR